MADKTFEAAREKFVLAVREYGAARFAFGIGNITEAEFKAAEAKLEKAEDEFDAAPREVFE